jgi:hypothetical protein
LAAVCLTGDWANSAAAKQRITSTAGIAVRAEDLITVAP